MKQESQEAKFGQDYGLDSVDVCAEVGYFFVFPFPSREKHSEVNSTAKPYILTYRIDCDSSLGQLLNQFQPKIPSLSKLNRLLFTFSSGYKLLRQYTALSLQKLLKKANIDGLVLFVQEMSQQDQKSYDNQCAMQDYLDKKQVDKLDFKLNINFVLEMVEEYVITVQVSDGDSVRSMVKLLLAELKNAFGVDLKQKDILQLGVLMKNGEKRLEIKNTSLAYVDSIVNWSRIRVQFKTEVHFQRKVIHPENKLIIYKENSQQYISEIFEKIQFVAFKNLYRNRLAPKHVTGEGQRVSLKVMDILIREDQTLSKLSAYFRASSDRETIKMVGRVVSEKMYFYKTMSSLAQLPEESFNIQDYICSQNPQQQKEVFRERLRKNIQNRAVNCKLEHFQNARNVQPIYIYTCENVHYADKENPERSGPVYRVVNKYLREDNLFKKEFKDFEGDWMYRFTQCLINQLRKVEPVLRTTVYRGINYDPKVKKGDIMTFKSFSSTSTNEKATYPFMDAFDSTLLELDILGGKAIKYFSDFSSEQEVLLQPFTQFKVISTEENPLDLFGKQFGKQVKRIKLQQLGDEESSDKYPRSIANFIIWIDDKKSEGAEMYRNVQLFEHPTILIQLRSTQQLKEWLAQERVGKIFADPTSNIIFISNMTREENPLAGIEGVIEFQKCECHMQFPIVFYVGNKEAALSKIAANRQRLRRSEGFLVLTDQKQLQHFISKRLKIHFMVRQLQKNIKNELKMEATKHKEKSVVESKSCKCAIM